MTKKELHTGREVFHGFLEEFISESDRASIILASAEMEVRLELLFTKFLKTNSELRQSLFSFVGPLGSFSARIKMAYALNLITKEFYELLDIFRDIRNKIVHKGVHASLEEPEVKESCEKILKYFSNSPKFDSWVFKIEGLTENQYRFRSAISFIIVMIEHTTEFLEPMNVTPHSCNPEEHIGE